MEDEYFEIYKDFSVLHLAKLLAHAAKREIKCRNVEKIRKETDEAENLKLRYFDSLTRHLINANFDFFTLIKRSQHFDTFDPFVGVFDIFENSCQFNGR